MTALTAFDADVLIYAADGDHPLGAIIRPLLEPVDASGVGSVLLLPEVLTKPMRHDPLSAETSALVTLLSRLDLRPVDEQTARVAVTLGGTYGLRAAEAVHLATAVVADADRFLTNNRNDFSRRIKEVEVTYPEDLDGASG